jgi:tRNA pseudouridine38-40 synthase
MKRFFITLAYNGKNYVGWQVQPNGISVQQKVQEALSTLLRKPIGIVGAGRTDAGVHAKKMVAHFNWEGEPFTRLDLIKKLNGFLPKDIAVDDIYEVRPDAHARFSAISRTYTYYVTTQKDPFLYELKYRVFFDPDIALMNTLCGILTEYKDFTSFSKLHSDVKTNNCRIEKAVWEKKGNDYVFTITANRFLRNMVRAIVGTLLDAGRGRIDEEGFRHIIESKNRNLAGTSAPAYALFLDDIVYPIDIRLEEK